MYHLPDSAHTRRRFLANLGLLSGAALALPGCQNGTVNTGLIGSLATDINNIGAALQNDLPALVSSGVLASSAAGKITAAVEGIATVAASVTSASTQAVGQTVVQQIETFVNSIVSAAAGMQLPAPFGLAFTAASILLPVIETGVGLVVNAVNTNTATTTAPGAAAPMSVADARLILAAHAAAK